nr:NADH dehydrogenase [ubiquinone] 1 alpha subcomplex subunit 13-like [Procambarus clarkii]
MAAAPSQDLPPRGGYAPITFARIPARSYFSGYQLFAGYAVVTSIAAYFYYKTYKKIKIREIEKRSGDLAIEPLLLAERDREFLKQMRRNRDEEAKLMANVEGWEVGKYYSEPIFKTVSDKRYIDPVVQEYYIHGPSSNYTFGPYFSLFT